MKRKEGYYWVKKGISQWPCYFSGLDWMLTVEGNHVAFANDSYFDSINETRILPPDEQNYGAKFNIDGVTYVSQRKP